MYGITIMINITTATIVMIMILLCRDIRSNVLEESLHKLGVEKLSKEDVQKLQWEVLEAKIGNWIHFMRIAVSTRGISTILVSLNKLLNM